ncbi:MAG TPA: S41 family peptidase [Thermoanaerobaculia bacterium]|nr:S41 family peptidase [Thermoanaerobaculia bacterium]
MTRGTIFLALSAIGLATVLGGAAGRRSGGDVSSAALGEYAQLVSTAESWNAAKVPAEKLVYASIHGMLSSLDPHTAFLEPDDFSSLEERHQGSYFGIGITMQRRQGRVTVMAVTQGTPAWKIGLRTGDVITGIDGESVDDSWDTRRVSEHVRGPRGTPVRLTIHRPGLAEPITVTVTRDEIPQNSVRHAFLVGDGAGYVQLAEFTQTSASEVSRAIEKLERDGMKRLVLDLRGNPGGVLDPALAIADVFLKKGQTIVTTRGRIPSADRDYAAAGRARRFEGPLVVLINRGSASASEIVAGAVQDHDRGLILGTTSWGKGLVQGVYPVSYGAGLALTTAKYFTPSGRWIQRDYSDLSAYLLPDIHDEAAPDAAKKNGKLFSTDAGRPVYAAGGITPDEIVPAPKPSPFARRLQAHGVFFNFAVDYLARHPDVARGFSVDPAVREELFRFVESQGIEKAEAARSEYLADPSRSRIDAEIAQDVLSSKFGPDEGWKSWLRSDIQMERALASFPQAERLANLKPGSISRS